jgi:hypothetical protein
MGHYRKAFLLMSPVFRAGHPNWPSNRAAADPGITIISIGNPQYGPVGAGVPVNFYARDRNPTPGSDTLCRNFAGTATLVSGAGHWRYDPALSNLKGTVVPSSSPDCPN